MVLEHLDLVPFGSMRPESQLSLASSLASLHLSPVHDALHKGRFGFPTSNFLAVTPLNNTWTSTWVEFFGRRLEDQLGRLHRDRQYGGKVLMDEDTILDDLGREVRGVGGLERSDSKTVVLPSYTTNNLR